MIRMFQRHKVRNVEELDGYWNFEPSTAPAGQIPGAYGYKMLVPGVWESHPGFRTYRGRAFFERTLDCAADSAYRFVFKGVSHTATVYWDGREIGRHYNAFTPFAIVVPEVKAGAHQLVVEVDNSFGPHSALHQPNDYYTYGGLSRPVAMERIGAALIEGVWATPSQRGKLWQLHVRATVRNVDGRPYAGRLVLTVAGVEVAEEIRLRPHQAVTVERSLRLTDVTPWSPDTPVLYPLNATLFSDDGKPCDDLIERVGFREIRVKGREILLNRRQLKLRGFNRHEDTADFGCAVPLAVMQQDLDLMADMGANFVRTAHYPNDERFLDMCDERGFLVWEEHHARALMADTMKMKVFSKQVADCDREMVLNHFNHPAIIMWGVFNECESFSKLGLRHYEASIKRIRALDPSRPITAASCYPRQDLTLGLLDIIAFNRYPGWYWGSLDTLGAELDTLLEWISESGNGNKPFIMSEFGAGAIPGWRAARRTKWTEEYQADLLQASLDVYLYHPRVNGTAIWQYCDVRVAEEEWFKTRPRTMNNKGVVDEYRRPKLAYEVVKKCFQTAAMRKK